MGIPYTNQRVAFVSPFNRTLWIQIPMKYEGFLFPLIETQKEKKVQKLTSQAHASVCVCLHPKHTLLSHLRCFLPVSTWNTGKL